MAKRVKRTVRYSDCFKLNVVKEIEEKVLNLPEFSPLKLKGNGADGNF